MTALLDAAVFMYAAGSPHPLKAPCARILGRVAAGTLDATTSAEVVQEVLHRYLAINRREGGVALAREILNGFRPVLEFTDATARRLPELALRYDGLSARDIVHIATCLENQLDTIISPDRGFDRVSGIRRLDPSETAA